MDRSDPRTKRMDTHLDPLRLATRRTRPRSARIIGRTISSLCILAGLVVGPRHAVGQDANAPTPPPANRTTSVHQEDLAPVAHDVEEPPWLEHANRFDSPKRGFQSYIGGRFISDPSTMLEPGDTLLIMTADAGG